MRSQKFYRQNEAEIMKQLGLKPTKNSGSGWVEKEDGQSEFVIAQLKSTDKMSISVQLKDINMLEYNASVSHKLPIFVLQFLQSNDVFVLVRPESLPGLHELIETGQAEIVHSVEIAPDESKAPTKQIKSGNRDAFWSEKEKERQRWQKKK